MTDFKDHFSGHADDYQRYRPQYPGRLFQYLVSLVRRRQLAWDCGTGNGQVAQVLSAYFNRVIATDASENQIRHALPADNITYQVNKAEEPDIEKNTVDLVTVGQALHWFDHEKFFEQARRIMKNEAVIAAWTYQLCYVNEELNELIHAYYHQVVGPYWPDEREMVEDGYEEVEFPFEEMDPPEMHMEADWTMKEFIGYLRTWSAAKRFEEDKNADPVEPLFNYFKNAWGDPEQKRRVYWPIRMRVGRKV